MALEQEKNRLEKSLDLALKLQLNKQLEINNLKKNLTIELPQKDQIPTKTY